MSSTAKRITRLFTRIADERAARGRPVETSRPKLAKTHTVAVLSAPEMRGSPAEFGRYEISPRVPTPLRHRNRQLFVRLYGSNGNFVDHPVGEVRDPIVASVELVKGIDYPDVLSAYADAWEHRQLKNDTPKIPDISLIDRLFAGWSPKIPPAGDPT